MGPQRWNLRTIFKIFSKGWGRQRLKILGVALGPFSRTVKMLGASKAEYILGGGFRVIFIKGSMFQLQELFKRLGASKIEYSRWWLWGHFQKLFKRLGAGWLWDHFAVTIGILERLWGHFELLWWLLWEYLRHMGVPLGSL